MRNEVATKTKNGFGLSANALKFIAIAAMLIDHIAWRFVETNSTEGFFMHLIGRMTIPIMSMFIAEGYVHTKNIQKYLFRLALFAVISQGPFCYFKTGRILNSSVKLNVIFSLLFALIALYVYDTDKIQSTLYKFVIILALCIVSSKADWSFAPILWALSMFTFRKSDKVRKMFVFFITTLLVFAYFIGNSFLIGKDIKLAYVSQSYMLGMFLAVVPITFYSGKRGSKNKFCKWFFYIFYPAHLLLIGILAYNVF